MKTTEETKMTEIVEFIFAQTPLQIQTHSWGKTPVRPDRFCLETFSWELGNGDRVRVRQRVGTAIIAGMAGNTELTNAHIYRKGTVTAMEFGEAQCQWWHKHETARAVLLSVELDPLTADQQMKIDACNGIWPVLNH